LGDLLYVADNGGILTCYTAKTGEEKYREEIGGELSSYSASPVAADGRLYLTDEYGTVFVVKAGPRYELLAKNSMGEVCMATPAISGKTLYVRGRRHLFAIGQGGD
jgi:outer membrane protein assembly factor BamB